MANNDSDDRKKSESGLPTSVLVIACICMIAPVLALVAPRVFLLIRTPVPASVEPNFTINILIAAATILTVVMVLVGLVLFSKLRDVKDEYDRICEIREKVENLWHELRKEVDEEVNRAKQVLGAVRKEIEQAVREEYDKREKQAKEAQRKRLEISEHWNKGSVLFGQKKYDEAIAEFSECLRIDPNSARACTNRGVAKGNKGDYDGAIADHNEAIRLNPKFAGAYYNRGVAKADKGDLDGAIADYTEAIKLDPRDAEVYNERGAARNNKGDFDGAIRDFEEFLRLAPNHPQAASVRELVLKLKEGLNK